MENAEYSPGNATSERDKKARKQYTRCCNICAVTVRSKAMWREHIQGKLHKMKSKQKWCDLCKTTVFGMVNWNQHISSKKHRARIRELQQSIHEKSGRKCKVENNGLKLRINNAIATEYTLDISEMERGDKLENMKLPRTEMEQITLYQLQTQNGRMNIVHRNRLPHIFSDQLQKLRDCDLNGIGIQYPRFEIAVPLKVCMPPQQINTAHLNHPHCTLMADLNRNLRQIDAFKDQIHGNRVVTYLDTLSHLMRILTFCTLDDEPSFIGVHRKGDTLILESILIGDGNHRNLKRKEVHSLLVKHLLTRTDEITNGQNSEPMDYQVQGKGTRYGTVTRVKMNDISILCAMEDIYGMNADETVVVVPSNDCECHDALQIINRLSKGDILQYWSQMHFGCISRTIFVLMKNGIVTKSIAVSRRGIQEQSSLLIVHGMCLLLKVLQWITGVCRQLDEGKLYVMKAERGQSNGLTVRLLKKSGDVCRRGNGPNGVFAYDTASQTIERIVP